MFYVNAGVLVGWFAIVVVVEFDVDVIIVHGW